MEQVLRDSIIYYIQTGQIKKEITFADLSERLKFYKRFKKFSLNENNDLIHSSKGKFPVGIKIPSWDKMRKVIDNQPKIDGHFSRPESLVTLLVENGFGMPKFLGGLKRVVAE